jgi:hypothetical protein
MKYLIPLFLFLASCTNPEFVVMKDQQGNVIHTTTPQSFFSSPDKASEWSFWYFVIAMATIWMIWREFKSVKWPKKKTTPPTESAQQPTDSSSPTVS